MKNQFKYPMLKSERVWGCAYIPLHCALPLLILRALAEFNLSFHESYSTLIYYTISFIFVLLIAFRFLRKSFSDLLDGFIRAVQSVILGYAFCFAMMFAVSAALSGLIPGERNPNTSDVLRLVNQSPGIMTVVTVVLAPIIEETLFRGALFGSIRQKSRVFAYIVSALLFSAYHLWQYAILDFSPALLLFALQYVAAAIALAWCYERGGTIWAPILMHAAINFISTRTT